jgi:uncharacterized protein (DUF488 family)
MMKKILYTIGHSTRTIEELIDLLKAHKIALVIDIRSIPHSRHNPQFNEYNLKELLKENHISYRHFKKLGGLRHTTKDSLNTGWINLSFRGFADYMGTEEFSEGLEQLKKMAEKRKTAILCAEAVPWRCHRSLIADALTVDKWKVFHIQSRKTAKEHKLTSFLKIKKGQLIYEL